MCFVLEVDTLNLFCSDKNSVVKSMIVTDMTFTLAVELRPVYGKIYDTERIM